MKHAHQLFYNLELIMRAPPCNYHRKLYFSGTRFALPLNLSQGRRNDIKSGGARFNGLNKVGDKVGILLTRIG